MLKGEIKLEEDFKKTEQLIKKCNRWKLKEYINCEISWTEIAALKRILDKYQELEQENKKLRNFKEKLTEINNKEAVDALCILLHCSLKDTDYETQNGQFDIIMSYIKGLEEDNNNHKAAALKNDDYYKEACHKNKELEEENNNLRKVKSDEFIVNNPWLFKYLNENYIIKYSLEQKIRELKKDICELQERFSITKEHDLCHEILTQIKIKRNIIEVLETLLGEGK